MEMLRRLQPTRDYLVMLKEEVLAALDKQRESAYEARKAAERRVDRAEKRRQRLIEAYLYERPSTGRPTSESGRSSARS